MATSQWVLDFRPSAVVMLECSFSKMDMSYNRISWTLVFGLSSLHQEIRQLTPKDRKYTKNVFVGVG